MELLNLVGLIFSFFGAVLLLADPTVWIMDDYTKTYIKERKSTMTIPLYSNRMRRHLIGKLWLKRAGISFLAAGFLGQLVPTAYNYLSTIG